MNWSKLGLIISLCTTSFLGTFYQGQKAEAVTTHPVINEVAWMGTTADANDEWIELYNPSQVPVDLSGWVLKSADGTPSIQLTGKIEPNGYYLLERSDDTTVPGIKANMIYTGALSNTGETLELIDPQNTIQDSIGSWYAGDAATKATMERKDAASTGNEASNWVTSTAAYDVGFGTPLSAAVSQGSQTEHLNSVQNGTGAMNVYFNKSALPEFSSSNNQANYNINLENRLINRINSATATIDMASYEINLPKVVDALINRAASGVRVRIIADAKGPSDPEHDERYELMRADLEKLLRGKDGVLHTSDDASIFSDSVMFAVEDPAKRQQYGLPADGYTDFTQKIVTVGSSSQTGYLLVDGESKSSNAYYAPDNQMHNKFVLIDGTWTFTGSWNFTTSGLYGTDANRESGILDGNSNHSIEFHSPELAAVYKTEFEEMWGGTTFSPDPVNANFGPRKSDNTPHHVTVGGKMVDVYFSPGDNAVPQMIDFIKTSANENTYFSIFAWSDQELVDALKVKWEGSDQDLQGALTGFDLKGVFEDSYWNMWWSASVDMTGRTASQTSTNNPNTRWKNPAPVYMDKEVRKLHHKYMIVDADTSSDPTVITGSTNWSTNGNDVNDENSLFVHDAAIANQFKQEFLARYQMAGGSVQ
ncbi:phospholipase D-like domain-containing protein [Fictibacillus sp. KIGAM418]|uniref:phospholipase D n=1 Tax=Fictibacillus marinisediminis TaxID=2878389 RepID=A0A9X2BFN9_9BACL|nr:phospholipase D-like domain-containing protein [Fictibacillus marinisediminis]MCK6255718.1 phospholipase D-like domain-containing protein [Fictibacillus marinisediminis]